MSVRVSTWVWEHSEARLTDRMVLLAIADCASDDGTRAWPSVATVAQKCRISLRASQAAIRRLIKDGHLLVEDQTGPRGTNRYTVVMTNICTPADSGLERGKPKSAPPQEMVETPADIGQTPADIGQLSPISAPVTVLEPSIEQPLEKPSDARDRTASILELANGFKAAMPISNLSRTRSVIALALSSGATATQIRAALNKLIEQNRGCTEETLRIALQELSPKRSQSTTNGRVQRGLELAAMYDQQDNQAAIEGAR